MLTVLFSGLCFTPQHPRELPALLHSQGQVSALQDSGTPRPGNNLADYIEPQEPPGHDSIHIDDRTEQIPDALSSDSIMSDAYESESNERNRPQPRKRQFTHRVKTGCQ